MTIAPCPHTAAVREIRLRTTVFLGVGALERLESVFARLREDGVRSVLCVCGGHAYRDSGAWDEAERAARSQGLKLALYNRVTPDPSTDCMDEAAALGRVVGAGAVLAIGGGSPIDCGKCAAALLANPGVTAEDLFCCRFRPRTALPLAAVPLTHGVGSEVNRFAVAALPRQRRASVIAHDCLYPRYAVEDPALMTGLSPDQTRYVSVDALSRVVEAATTTVSNPFVVMLARETVRLVHRWLPAALQRPDDLEARYGLCLAAIQAGLAFDNGLLHMAHALEQPLRGVCDAPHGLRLAVLLPAVVRECYPACAPVAADILAPLAPGLRGLPEEAPKAARAVEQWLFSVGLTQKLLNLGVQEPDVEKFCTQVECTPSLGPLLSVAPVPSSHEVVARIYRQSLRPMP